MRLTVEASLELCLLLATPFLFRRELPFQDAAGILVLKLGLNANSSRRDAIKRHGGATVASCFETGSRTYELPTVTITIQRRQARTDALSASPLSPSFYRATETQIHGYVCLLADFCRSRIE